MMIQSQVNRQRNDGDKRLVDGPENIHGVPGALSLPL